MVFFDPFLSNLLRGVRSRKVNFYVGLLHDTCLSKWVAQIFFPSELPLGAGPSFYTRGSSGSPLLRVLYFFIEGAGLAFRVNNLHIMDEYFDEDTYLR